MKRFDFSPQAKQQTLPTNHIVFGVRVQQSVFRSPRLGGGGPGSRLLRCSIRSPAQRILACGRGGSMAAARLPMDREDRDN
jgi:hypothetical protein